MAVSMPATGMRVARLQHVRLCSAQAKRLTDFYESALGFRRVAVEHLSGARARERFGVAGRTLRITLQLGAQRVKLLQYTDQPGRAYPVHARASDLSFQHFAIVVADMPAAMAQLGRAAGWTSITTGGPQSLPASSGGVTAFKFRDPEGHPLELLQFPADHMPARWEHVQAHGPFLGIDHSAISVADSARSMAFYQSLGLAICHRSVNDDPAQARLDALDHARVEVTAMDVGPAPPHLELLCYRDRGEGKPVQLRPNDVAATCLVFEADEGSRPQHDHRMTIRDLVDPDGHRLAIVRPSA